MKRSRESKRSVLAPGGGIRYYFEGPAGGNKIAKLRFPVVVESCGRQQLYKNAVFIFLKSLRAATRVYLVIFDHQKHGGKTSLEKSYPTH